MLPLENTLLIFLIGDLALEVDGARWHDSDKDKKRDQEIWNQNKIRVLRFSAQSIKKDPSIVKTFIGHGV